MKMLQLDHFIRQTLKIELNIAYSTFSGGWAKIPKNRPLFYIHFCKIYLDFL
jgi:hypothetical protein